MKNLIENTNEITNEIFNRYEHVLRNVSFEECLEFAQECSKEQFLEEAQDFIHYDIESWIFEDNNLEYGKDSEEAREILIKHREVEYDKILEHLMKNVTIKYA